MIFSRWLMMAFVLLVAGCAGLSVDKQQRLEAMQANAQLARGNIQQRLQDSPESVAQESLALLDTILEYADTVKSDPDKFNDQKIQEYLLKINIINENIQRFNDLTLETDVSFPLGTYKLEHLSAQGKQASDELVDKIVSSLQELLSKYPGNSVRITVKTIGYTDEMPVTPGTSLEKVLRGHIGDDMPQAPAARRAKYNEALSYLRAETVNEYLADELRVRLAGVQIEQKIVGRGETLPGNKDAAYRANDPRRRICVISPFIEIMP